MQTTVDNIIKAAHLSAWVINCSAKTWILFDAMLRHYDRADYLSPEEDERTINV